MGDCGRGESGLEKLMEFLLSVLSRSLGRRTKGDAGCWYEGSFHPEAATGLACCDGGGGPA